MNHRTLAIATAFFVAATAASAEVSRKDQTFFTKAAADGMYEVEAGKLAQSRGQSEAVKGFGGMLIKDQTQAHEELKALATRKGATLPTALSADKKRKLDKLANEKNFDRKFLEEVGMDDHKDDIKLFEKASKDADDADVKAFAAKMLPTLRSHREHAEGLKKSLVR